MYGTGNVSQEAPPLPPMGLGFDWQRNWGFQGLGATAARQQKIAARQQKTAARKQARQVTIAGRRVNTTADPKQLSALQNSLTSLQRGQSTLNQLAQQHQRTRTTADRNKLLSFAKVHMKNLVDAAGGVSPQAAQIAKGAAAKANAHNNTVKQAAARRAANQQARAQRRLRGFSDIDPMTGCDTSDPTCGGTIPPPVSGGCDPTYDPTCGGTMPPPYDPTTGLPPVTGGGLDMSSMLPLLLMGGGIGGSSGTTAGCTNPNLPRCIIANMAAQDRQQFMFIIMIIMMMQQQATQTLTQSLGASAYGSQMPYGYGQTPYGAPPYGASPYGDPYGASAYGQPPYGSPYGSPYGYPTPGDPYGDVSAIPPGFDDGSGGGGDVFAPGSGNIPSSINSVYPGPVAANNSGGGNLISSNQLPDGVATDTDGNPVGGDGGSGQGQAQPQIGSQMYAQSTSVSQGPMQVMMAPSPYMQPQLQYTDYAFATPNAVGYPYSQAMPPQMPGGGQPMQSILMSPMQAPPEMESPEKWASD